MMHAIKGGWVGQTFALAKCNESEGKKSRIRRSKEERKTMVESFVKKYQTSNNGNFPSLNLTHKEVGGSFYTVREIVREIIQENRVLGPAKLIAEELNTNQIDEEYPLGTISTEPETPLDITSNESPFVPSHQEGNNEEQESFSAGLGSKHENQMFDYEQIVNENQVDVKTEDSAKSTYEELQTSKSIEMVKSVGRLVASTAKVTPITADVVVEMFPVRPAPKTADYSTTLPAAKNSSETLEKNEIEKVNLEAGNDSVPSDQIHSSKNSGLVYGQNGTILAGVTLDKNPDLMTNKVVEKIADPLLKSSDCSNTEGGTVPDTVIGRNVEFEVSHNDVLTSEINAENQGIDRTKEINVPKGKILNDSSREESKTPKANVIFNEAGVLNKGTFQNGSNPTIDRINLEAWEKASTNSAETETNPLVAIFKSFVTAFVKFWSE